LERARVIRDTPYRRLQRFPFLLMSPVDVKVIGNVNRSRSLHQIVPTQVQRPSLTITPIELPRHVVKMPRAGRAPWQNSASSSIACWNQDHDLGPRFASSHLSRRPEHTPSSFSDRRIASVTGVSNFCEIDATTPAPAQLDCQAISHRREHRLFGRRCKPSSRASEYAQ